MTKNKKCHGLARERKFKKKSKIITVFCKIKENIGCFLLLGSSMVSCLGNKWYHILFELV
jgi:hypothetical protein